QIHSLEYIWLQLCATNCETCSILDLVVLGLLALPKLLCGKGHCWTRELNLSLVSELYKLYVVIASCIVVM
ncbi:hypothetical protein CMV_027820, partial [Castanea mollissima]